MRAFTTPTSHRRHRGMTAVLAMVFLVLMSVVSLGFFATTSMSVQVTGNEVRNQRAMVAADAGVQFVRYHLWNMTIPPLTEEEDLVDAVYNQLADRLDGQPNMQGTTVEMPDENTILLPGGGKYIVADDQGGKFRAVFTRVGKKMRVKVTGAYQPPTAGGGAPVTTSARGIQLDFDVAEKASSIFDYGLAARGRIETGGTSWVRGATDSSKGSVMSAAVDPVNPTVTLSGKGITGSVSYLEGSARPTISGSVGTPATTNQTTIFEKYVTELSDPPIFPVVDLEMFRKYAKTDYKPGVSTSPFVNLRVPAGSNPSFGSGDKIQGILFIEMPNEVKFTGKVDIQGMIVVDPKGTTDLTKNTIKFSGNSGTKTGVETLPLNDSRFNGLRDLTGSFILAPGTHVTMTGNFGMVNGSVIADKVEITGSVTADVKGSIITLNPDETLRVWGSGDVIISSTGTTNYPAGLRFGEHYYPVPGSYVEVKP